MVEVVSRNNPGRDQVTKFNNYLAVGVAWYWLIDAESLIQEEYHAEQGRYFRTAAAEAGGIFRLAALQGQEREEEGEEKEILVVSGLTST